MLHLLETTDIKILFFIQDHFRNSSLDKIMPLITKLGNIGIIWLVIGGVLLVIKKYRKIGVMIFISIFLCAVTGNLILKPLVARIRPFDLAGFTQLLISAPKDFSFPSGHTMASFAAASVLASQNKVWGILAFILAFVIGFSRLYLFVHFPSDVVAGAVIGSILGIISVKLYNKFIQLQIL